MPIDTVNEKLAVMEMGDMWEPALPISPGTLGQDDQQQLLWGYPGILWGAATVVLGDIVTTSSAFFRRVVTTGQATIRRTATASSATFARTVTGEDLER